MNRKYVYHVCTLREWQMAKNNAVYFGSSQDLEDGFIHCSSRDQVISSVAKHRDAQDDLIMLVLDPEQLGSHLKWEPSRSGTLYPHIYDGLPLGCVVTTHPLNLRADGTHNFPDEF